MTFQGRNVYHKLKRSKTINLSKNSASGQKKNIIREKRVYSIIFHYAFLITNIHAYTHFSIFPPLRWRAIEQKSNKILSTFYSISFSSSQVLYTRYSPLVRFFYYLSWILQAYRWSTDLAKGDGGPVAVHFFVLVSYYNILVRFEEKNQSEKVSEICVKKVLQDYN